MRGVFVTNKSFHVFVLLAFCVQRDRANALGKNDKLFAPRHAPAHAGVVNVRVNAGRAGEQRHGYIHLLDGKLIRLNVLRTRGIDNRRQNEHQHRKERQAGRRELPKHLADAAGSSGWRNRAGK